MMSREARIEYPDAAYHVMNRGNRGADIFFDGDDRSIFLKTFGETGERQAEKLVVRVLEKVKLRDVELEHLSKCDSRKQALVWLLRSRTSASTKWIARRLSMGDPSNVSRVVGAVQDAKDGKRKCWGKLLPGR